MAKGIVINTEELRELLYASKIAERKKAIKYIGKNKIDQLSSEVISLLKKEYDKKKSWQFIVEIIDVLGEMKVAEVKDFLYDICKNNVNHDMITASAAMAYCRISRTTANDVSSVLELLSFGGFSVVNGALKSLAIDKIVPKAEDINIIIEKVKNFEPKHEKGYADVRVGLVVASAGWRGGNVKDFLEKCMQNTSYEPLKKMALMSLKGKYYNL